MSQLLTESLLLALGGGLLGLLLALGAVNVLAHTGAGQRTAALAQARVDFRLFAFALGISLVTGILFGLAPALRDSGASLSIDLE